MSAHFLRTPFYQSQNQICENIRSLLLNMSSSGSDLDSTVFDFPQISCQPVKGVVLDLERQILLNNLELVDRFHNLILLLAILVFVLLLLGLVAN
ncbi:hypothetical protein A9F13_23g00352 [Clavispora lusitaniae]|uniref:Uncharacterized protein n=1 Tax=Clavispora lusitaniae TaxID=36911 RepID=A0AA91PVF8_CLALS|nr:hypothetical protein A9F13_23g00352 [Clavispora lusitaniae]